MLRNPFTPTQIASQPGNFVGRRDELRTLERSLVQGSVAIQGPVGIGKSSLLGRGLLSMEGFGTHRSARAIVAVGNRETDSIDKAARLLLARDDDRYGLVDEFLRIRMIMDSEKSEIARAKVEERLLYRDRRDEADDELSSEEDAG